MVTRFQEKALKTFRGRAMGWERAAEFVGIGDKTFDALVAQGYLEDCHEGGTRWLRITAKGERAVDEGLF